MERVLDFISTNYIWFIIAGSILLIIALILILVKKNPVKEEKIETKENNEPVITEEVIDEPIIDEIKEPVIEKIDDFSFESIVDATPVEDATEVLDIIDDSVVNEEVNTDSIKTSDEDIWKF